MTPDREQLRMQLRGRIDQYCRGGVDIHVFATSLLEALECIMPHLRVSTEPQPPPVKGGRSRGAELRDQAAVADAFDAAIRLVREAARLPR
jgi:hypothetical protein